MKKNIIVLIVLLLILNNAVVMGVVETPINTSSPVIQTAVFQLVSVARLPYTVMTNVLRGVPFLPEYRQSKKDQNPSKNSKNHDPQDNKFVFISNADEGSRSNLKIDNNEKTGTNIFQAAIPDVSKLDADLSPAWTGFVCIFLLIYLVLLAKSNLPWEIVKLSVGKSPIAL